MSIFFNFSIYLPFIMLVTLRNYQHDAVEKIKQAYRNGLKSPLLVLPTGGGKTVVFCNIAERTARKDHSVYILVHRQELLRQTSDHLDLLGVQHGVIAPGHSMTGDAVQVASVQTLARRLHRVQPPDLVVLDEAHHAPAGTWKKILTTWPSSRILGVTATPIRMDGKGLGISVGGFFDTLVEGPTIRWLIDNGHLSQPKVYAPPTDVNLKGVRSAGGDYIQSELSARMDKPTITGSAIEHDVRLCPGVPAIAFCASVKPAEHVAGQFNAAGIEAESLTGDLSDGVRKHRIMSLASGRIKVLTACDIISEGTDIPVVTAAILLRPTQSTGLCLQQVGRALRPHPGKTHAIILDHVGNCLRHGLPDEVRKWSIDEGEVRAKNKKSASLPRSKSCEKCYAAYSVILRACPQCGHINEGSERDIKQVDGELREVNHITIDEYKRRLNRLQQGQARDLPSLLNIAHQRGYNPQWAYHVFNAKKAKEFQKNLRGQQMRLAV
jgi:DNA repair protein RadD